MLKTNTFKNGGFPPIKYCSNITLDINKKNSKERFFSNASRQNINIRQLLSDNKKKQIIITETIQDDNIEIIDSL